MVNAKSNWKWLFVSDVDDTLLGDETALENLARKLSGHRQSIVIAYNSSRPCASVRTSLATHPGIPEPDYIIGALGTEIEDARSRQLDLDYSQRLKVDWDRDSIAKMMHELGFQPHRDEYQTPYKASYNVSNMADYQIVLDHLDEKNIRVNVIYSGGVNLDLIPKNADKGLAVVDLRQLLNLPSERVVVAGDSGNDVDMFLHNFKGIVVGNADEDLKTLSGTNIYQAKADYADGVLEGLHFWGVVP